MPNDTPVDSQTTPTLNAARMPTVNSVMSGSLLGAPLAIVAVWSLNAHRATPIPPEVATALGSVVSTVVSGLWHIVTQLLEKVGIHVSP